MAPLCGFSISSANAVSDTKDGYSCMNGAVTIGIIFSSVTTFVALIVLVTMCGCCGKSKRKSKRRKAEKHQAEAEPEDEQEVPEGETKRSKQKTTKTGRDKKTERRTTKESKLLKDTTTDADKQESKLRESRKPATTESKQPVYVEVGPGAAAVAAVEGAGQPRYVEVSVQAPLKRAEESKKREPPPADRAGGREPAYRTLYGVGDNFQASDRQQVVKKEEGPKKATYLSIRPEGAEPPKAGEQKPRYLSWALDPKAPE